MTDTRNPGPNNRWPRPILKYLAPAYLVAILALWLVMRLGADEAAVPTLFLFGPRWITALPLVLLIPLAIYMRSIRAGVVTLVAAAIVAGPITGGTIPLGRVFASDPPALTTLRVVTWNTDNVRLGQPFQQFLAEVKPDVVLLQECGHQIGMDLFPEGWSINSHGGRRVASRFPVRQKGEWKDSTQRGGVWCVIDTVDGEIPIVNVHLPTVRTAMEDVLHNQFRDLTELRKIIGVRKDSSRNVHELVCQAGPSVIVAGDFNLTVESRIYREDWSMFRNAFSDAGLGWGTTFHTRRIGLRIDHILYTSTWECRKVWLSPAMGSAHQPVVADLARIDN